MPPSLSLFFRFLSGAVIQPRRDDPYSTATISQAGNKHVNQQRKSIKGRSRKHRSSRPKGPMPLGGMEFTLPADLGIEHAATLHTTLAPLLATIEPVALAAHEVSRLHTASLQVLAAFVRERAAAGGPTTWREPSSLLRESAIRAGLDAALGLTAASSN
jgi:hypothetical protein